MFFRGSIVPSPSTARSPRSALGPSTPRPGPSPGRASDDPAGVDPERRLQVGGGEARSSRRRRRRSPPRACAFVACIEIVRARAPLRVVERHEVVEHRRPHAAALRGVHPLAEDERVERAGEALDRRPAQPAPRRAERVRGGQRDQPLLARGCPRAPPGSAPGPGGWSARTRRARARRRRRTPSRRASRGCSCRSPSADARAGRRRRRPSCRLLVHELVEVHAELAPVGAVGQDVGGDERRVDREPHGAGAVARRQGDGQRDASPPAGRRSARPAGRRPRRARA